MPPGVAAAPGVVVTDWLPAVGSVLGVLGAGEIVRRWLNRQVIRIEHRQAAATASQAEHDLERSDQEAAYTWHQRWEAQVRERAEEAEQHRAQVEALVIEHRAEKAEWQAIVAAQAKKITALERRIAKLEKQVRVLGEEPD